MERNIRLKGGGNIRYYEYFISPKPGYTIEDACEINTETEAEIAEYKAGDATGIFIPNTPRNKVRFRPKFPPSYYSRKQKIIQRTGITIMDKPLYEERLAAGDPPTNPFFQLILIAISRSENPSQGVIGLKESEVIKYLIEEIRVFPDAPSSALKIRALLDVMSKKTLLVKKGDYWARGLTLKGGDRMIDWRQGYDPVEDQLLIFIKHTGYTSREDCHKFIMNYLGWISRRKVINNYIRGLKDKGCISIQNNNLFSYQKPLSPFKTKKKP